MNRDERRQYWNETIMAKFDEIRSKLRELDLRGTTPLRESVEQLKETVIRRLLTDDQLIGEARREQLLAQAHIVSAPIVIGPQSAEHRALPRKRIMAMVVLMIAATVLITSAVNGKSLIKINLDRLVAFFTRESSLPPPNPQSPGADAAAIETASASAVETANNPIETSSLEPTALGTAPVNTSVITPTEPEASTAEVNTSSTPTAEQPREQATEAPEPGSQAPAVETEEVSHVQPLELVNGPVTAELQADGTWLAKIHLRRGAAPDDIDDRPGQCEGTRRNGPPGIRVNAISIVHNDDGDDCYLMNITAFGGADPNRLRAEVIRVP